MLNFLGDQASGMGRLNRLSVYSVQYDLVKSGNYQRVDMELPDLKIAGPADRFGAEQMLHDYPRHPAAEFYRLWQSLCGSDPLPFRQSFLPEKAGKFLRWLTVFDVEMTETGKPRFRYRLMGGETRELYGVNPVGKLLQEVVRAPHLSERQKFLTLCCTTDTPQFGRRQIPVESRKYFDVVHGIFPFAIPDDGRQIFLVAGADDAEL